MRSFSDIGGISVPTHRPSAHFVHLSPHPNANRCFVIRRKIIQQLSTDIDRKKKLPTLTKTTVVKEICWHGLFSPAHLSGHAVAGGSIHPNFCCVFAALHLAAVAWAVLTPSFCCTDRLRDYITTSQRLGFHSSVSMPEISLKNYCLGRNTFFFFFFLSPGGLPEILFYQYRDSRNLGSLYKASDINASFLLDGANFVAYLCFTTKNPAVIITRQAAL